jgi:uncharacterized RDD family membrane protein YckC
VDTSIELDDARLRVDSITGVPLDLAVAGPGGRSFAFIIDFHIRALAGIAWFFGVQMLVTALAASRGLDPFKWMWVASVPALLIYLAYHPLLEILMGGRTPGKRMAGIRIVTTDGSVPATGALLLRNVFRFVDGLPALYIVGLVTSIVTERNQRVGDLAAGTLLIYDDAGKSEDLGEVSRAGAARGISTSQAELVQDLIDRWSTLDAEDRLELARRLIARLDPAGGDLQIATLNNENALRVLQGFLGGQR